MFVELFLHTWRDFSNWADKSYQSLNCHFAGTFAINGSSSISVNQKTITKQSSVYVPSGLCGFGILTGYKAIPKTIYSEIYEISSAQGPCKSDGAPFCLLMKELKVSYVLLCKWCFNLFVSFIEELSALARSHAKFQSHLNASIFYSFIFVLSTFVVLLFNVNGLPLMVFFYQKILRLESHE